MGCLQSLYESMQDSEGDASYVRHDEQHKLKSMYADLERMMKRGEVFVKHNLGLKSFSAERWVYMSEDGQKIIWKKLNEDAYEVIYLYNVTNVIKGIGTEVMQKKAKKQHENLCWSIVTEDRSLDLQAQTQEIRDRWVDGVRLAMTHSTLLSPEELQLSEAKRIQTEEEERQRRETAMRKNESRRAELRALREKASMLSDNAMMVHGNPSTRLLEA